MDFEKILSIAYPVIMIILGFITIWIKENKKISDSVSNLIVDAEYLYKDYSKSGGEKFNWVVDSIYQIIPVAIKPFFPRSMIENIVQNAFNAIENYAKLQLDKISTSVIEGETKNVEGN